MEYRRPLPEITLTFGDNMKWLKKLFSKETPKPAFDIKKFEERWPVGSWYTSGSKQIVRLSNVYIKDGNPLITIEYPKLSPVKNIFSILKEDDLSPSYLNGWSKVPDKEQQKLENSYWKTIENQLQYETEANKRTYGNFVKVGNK